MKDLAAPPLPAARGLRRVVLRWLQADQPHLSAGEQETAAEVARHYPWNLRANLADGAVFWFGYSFISPSTILPLFVIKLTGSSLAVGLVAVIASGAWFLPQILSASWIERLPRMKPVVVRAGFFLERLPVWFLAVAALLAGWSPATALAVFFLAYAWRGLGGGVVAPAWQDMIARCFPVERRGRFLGVASFLGAGAGAGGAVLSTWLLKTLDFPLNFVAVFSIAAACVSLSWFFLSLTREPAQPPAPSRTSHDRLLAKVPRILRGDTNFRRFLAARWLMALGTMGIGFVTVSAVQRWQVPDATVGLFTAAFWLGQTTGYLCFGFLSDRFGNKLSLELGVASLALACALTWLAPSVTWIYAVFFFVGVSVSAQLSSGLLVALEFSAPRDRPTYVGLINGSTGLVNLLAPLLGAWLASISYPGLFAIATVVNVMALVALHWAVREPRWAASPG